MHANIELKSNNGLNLQCVVLFSRLKNDIWIDSLPLIWYWNAGSAILILIYILFTIHFILFFSDYFCVVDIFDCVWFKLVICRAVCIVPNVVDFKHAMQSRWHANCKLNEIIYATNLTLCASAPFSIALNGFSATCLIIIVSNSFWMNITRDLNSSKSTCDDKYNDKMCAHMKLHHEVTAFDTFSFIWFGFKGNFKLQLICLCHTVSLIMLHFSSI